MRTCVLCGFPCDDHASTCRFGEFQRQRRVWLAKQLESADDK